MTARPGDYLAGLKNSPLPVVGVRSYTATIVTYNLTVADLHTYYVVAGNTPILVHNAGCDEFAAKLQKKIGGEIWTITPKYGLPNLGDYKLANESWGHHTFVLKDGRVYDQFTGSGGMPLDEWKTQWSYPDDHAWTLVSPAP